MLKMKLIQAFMNVNTSLTLGLAIRTCAHSEFSSIPVSSDPFSCPLVPPSEMSISPFSISILVLAELARDQSAMWEKEKREEFSRERLRLPLLEP